MKKIVLGLALLVAALVFGASAGGASGDTFCKDVIIAASNGQTSGPPGTVLTESNTHAVCWPAYNQLFYFWKRDGVNIPGANSINYTTTADDVGHTITVHVSGTDGFGHWLAQEAIDPFSVTAAQTYDQAISYTQSPPAFSPSQTVTVASGSALKTAVANIAAGQLIKASAPFTYSTSTCNVLTISKALTNWAQIDLTGVTIKYTGTSNCHAVDISAASHIRIYGGDLSTSDTGGDCINDHGSNNVLWWGFNAHNCGGSGVAILAAVDGGGAPDHLDFQGLIHDVTSHAWDPHSEKGTGVHGAILWDGSASLPFTNNRLAFDVQNDAVGACVEIGQSPGSSTPSNGNTLYMRCNGNACRATTQTCGNGLQLWGQTSNLILDVKYLEVDNYAGYPTYGHAISSGQNASNVTVEYGRATNDKTNPYPSLAFLWDNTKGIVYQDVQPAP